MGFPRCFVATHTRRVCRHSGHSNADRVWLPFEESDTRTNWDVTLDDGAFHQRRVARSGIRWNTDLGLEGRKVPIFLNLDIRSVVL